MANIQKSTLMWGGGATLALAAVGAAYQFNKSQNTPPAETVERIIVTPELGNDVADLVDSASPWQVLLPANFKGCEVNRNFQVTAAIDARLAPGGIKRFESFLRTEWVGRAIVPLDEAFKPAKKPEASQNILNDMKNLAQKLHDLGLQDAPALTQIDFVMNRAGNEKGYDETVKAVNAFTLEERSTLQGITGLEVNKMSVRYDSNLGKCITSTNQVLPVGIVKQAMGSWAVIQMNFSIFMAQAEKDYLKKKAAQAVAPRGPVGGTRP